MFPILRRERLSGGNARSWPGRAAHSPSFDRVNSNWMKTRCGKLQVLLQSALSDFGEGEPRTFDTRSERTTKNPGSPGFLYAWQGDVSRLPHSHQVQVMTPLVMAQVFAVCVWLAVALQDGGGPATAVTITVTFCEGEKPWRGAAAVAVPEK